MYTRAGFEPTANPAPFPTVVRLTMLDQRPLRHRDLPYRCATSRCPPPSIDPCHSAPRIPTSRTHAQARLALVAGRDEALTTNGIDIPRSGSAKGVVAHLDW